MSVWAIADLHLSFGVSEKSMDLFGGAWVNHAEKLKTAWTQNIKAEDLVLIPGDISWAMRSEEALIDLQWIDALPGTKLLLRGNHDYWWGSIAKVRSLLPPSCHALQNDAFYWKGIAIAGSRLWDSPEYSFGPPNLDAPPLSPDDQKVFERELLRLEMSLKAMRSDAPLKIAMTHYPPISLTLAPSRASALLEKYGISYCVFGHLHNMPPQPYFGERGGVKYLLTACDYLNCTPLQIV